MMPIVFWSLAALVLLGCGWLASAWFYKRKIAALRQQVKAVRQTAAEHAAQAKKQIGMLQTELARRPPAPPRSLPAAVEPPAEAESARAAADSRKANHGFEATVIGPSGFAPTQVME